MCYYTYTSNGDPISETSYCTPKRVKLPIKCAVFQIVRGNLLNIIRTNIFSADYDLFRTVHLLINMEYPTE